MEFSEEDEFNLGHEIYQPAYVSKGSPHEVKYRMHYTIPTTGSTLENWDERELGRARTGAQACGLVLVYK